MSTTAILVSSISLVFGNFTITGEDIVFEDTLSKNVYLGHSNLNKTIVGFSSMVYLGDMKIHSICNTNSRYLGDDAGVYLFEVEYIDESCTNPYIYLKREDKIFLQTQVKLNVVSKLDILNVLLDVSDDTLHKVWSKYKESSEKKELFKNYTFSGVPESFGFAKKARNYSENIYMAQFVDDIITKRGEKYLIPVPGYSISKEKTKLPNAPRPYRSSNTDGTHHSWDIDAPLGASIVSLDDAIVVRIVDDWTWDKLSNLRSGNLSEEDKLRNLDIYRGNQIWLKTMKGEIVMYAHLDTIVSDLQEGKIVKKGSLIGTIGVSGVPQADYSDYHLDFSIHENPYNDDTAGTYGIDEYMAWPWKFKNKDYEYIVKHQTDIFTNPS